jgi:hypothetical protein
MEKSILAAKATTNNKMTAGIRRSIIRVTGVISAIAILVAIKEAPHDTTANISFQYSRNLFFSTIPFDR